MTALIVFGVVVAVALAVGVRDAIADAKAARLEDARRANADAHRARLLRELRELAEERRAMDEDVPGTMEQ